MLGYGPNIVGTSEIAKRIPLFHQIYPGIEKVPLIGVNSAHEINPEQVIALNAQLLTIPANMHLSQPELLSQTGVKTLELKANSMEVLRERVYVNPQGCSAGAGKPVKRQYRSYGWRKPFTQHDLLLLIWLRKHMIFINNSLV